LAFLVLQPLFFLFVWCSILFVCLVLVAHFFVFNLALISIFQFFCVLQPLCVLLIFFGFDLLCSSLFDWYLLTFSVSVYSFSCVRFSQSVWYLLTYPIFRLSLPDE
jgi:hypothetical protein